MRRFVTVGHAARADGAWSLDDLVGAGRVDVLCRNVQAALFLGAGLRADAEALLVFHADRGRQRTVRVRGAAAKELRPDERSVAAWLRDALRATGDDAARAAGWREVRPGLDVAPWGLADLVARLPGPFVVPDPRGVPVAEAGLPADATFVLGDHLPLAPAEERVVAEAGAPVRVSVGAPWYHGSHVVAVLHHFLDARWGAGPVAPA